MAFDTITRAIAPPPIADHGVSPEPSPSKSSSSPVIANQTVGSVWRNARIAKAAMPSIEPAMSMA